MECGAIRGRDCLANANNVEFRTKRTDHFGDIADLILEREGACLLWHVTGIEPVGHSNQVAVPEEVDHEVTEQYRKPSRKRRYHQEPILIGLGARKRDQVCKRPRPNGAFNHFDRASSYTYGRDVERPARPWIAPALVALHEMVLSSPPKSSSTTL